jgi:glycosyltransferase involved in cell wall biosynthesis
LHGADIFAVNGVVLNYLKLFILKNSDAVIVVSSAMRQKVLSMGIGKEKISIIPMGVDLEKVFIPPVNRTQDKNILFVGRFVKKKGLLYLLQAMVRIIEKHPDVHLNIAGHGPEEKTLKKTAKSLNLDSNVTFLGPVENSKLPSLYQSAQIVVFPFVEEAGGDMEGFGLVMVEALGCECAVVAADVPAIHDILTDKKTGLIVAQRNVCQLADNIICLLEDPDMRRRFGCAGRHHVLERFDWEITSNKHCRLFQKLDP